MVSLTRSQFLRRVSLAGLGFAFAVTVSACAANQTGRTNSQTDPPEAETTPQPTVLTIGIDPSFPPFQSELEGELEGFEIDLLYAIAEASGIEVELEAIPFEDMISALEAGTIDATMSAMTITSERAERVDFSRPYFQSGLAIVVPSLEEEITSVEDLQGKRIGAQSGTTGFAKASEVDGEVVAFQDSISALQALANGEVDAVINDAPVNRFVISSGTVQGIRNVEEKLTEEYYGIATPQGAEILEQLNQGLATVIEDGTYEEIYRNWFENEPPELPESVPLSVL